MVEDVRNNLRARFNLSILPPVHVDIFGRFSCILFFHTHAENGINWIDFNRLVINIRISHESGNTHQDEALLRGASDIGLFVDL